MAPKKVPLIEEIEDFERSLDFLGEEVSAVRLQQKNILDLVEEVKALLLFGTWKKKRESSFWRTEWLIWNSTLE